MKILHTADIHLREDRPERWDALRAVLDLGRKETVDSIIITGDLFDADIDAIKLKAKLRELFSGVNCDIFIIPGNHDARSFEDRAFFGPRVKVIGSFTDKYETGDAVITGIPFKNINELELYSILRNISENLNPDKCNILLYHGELLDSYYSRKDFGEEGDSRYMPVRLDFFTELKFDYILAGHFHTNYNVWEFGRQGGSGYFVYSGSPVSVTRRETGKRKVNIFNTHEAPREILLDSFFYESININLDPFSDIDPVTAVKQNLSLADPRARLLLVIDGYINSTKHGIDETKFNEELDVIKNNKKIEEVVFNAVDLGRILEDDLFKTFDSKLNSGAYSTSEKSAMREIFLKAMMESLA